MSNNVVSYGLQVWKLSIFSGSTYLVHYATVVSSYTHETSLSLANKKNYELSLSLSSSSMTNNLILSRCKLGSLGQIHSPNIRLMCTPWGCKNQGPICFHFYKESFYVLLFKTSNMYLFYSFSYETQFIFIFQTYFKSTSISCFSHVSTRLVFKYTNIW